MSDVRDIINMTVRGKLAILDKLQSSHPHFVVPFPGTGCPAPNVGFNYIINLYQMLDMIDIL